MFRLNPESAGNSNSVGAGPGTGPGAEAEKVVHRFVWPYGGRQVFITGSFSGWTGYIPMSPMEGDPTQFEVYHHVPPGYHQYKFNVDGDWCHDENAPYTMTGNYGNANTVFVTRESGVLDAPEVNMDVDGTAHGGILTSRISEADVQVSRHRISVFLMQHTAYELLPESGKVVALDITLPVKQAFHILYEQGVPVAPLWDFAKGHFVGVLSALDFILILMELGTHGSNLTEEELETHTILAWKEGKHNRQIDGSGRPYARQLIYAGPYDSLKDVALKILQNKVSTVPIIHSSSPDGSFPQLLHLASLSGILKCICRHFKHSSSSLPILQQPICSLPLGTWVPKIGDGGVLSVCTPNTSLGTALSLLAKDDISSVPIVSETNNALLDIYSRSDITSLAKDRAYAQVRLDEMSIHQALQLGQDANSPSGVFNGQRCQMCLRTDPLHKVMERLADPGVRRLVITEPGSRCVEGIITLSDVFRFLLG